ncbi:MAG: DUF1638 domain-containing protein [Methylococcales bacterium]|nr:DUF1638 domain-containing protein [Methylococcales bacterium]MDD5755408.1 DUF1638 domain-containing protein [Methylococcales bacterium]
MTQKMIPIFPEKPMVMVGCGILHKEVDFLIKKNGWNVETQFLASALHNYFDRLHNELNEALSVDDAQGRETIVFYGSCHPRMDDILTKHHTHRTQGQNCIVMLLGFEKFMEELGKGAYFLLEDWALTWEPMLTECFGKNPAVIREIFHSSHKMVMALRTPCSTDFTVAAQAAADFVDLPLVWMDVSLDHLEAVLLEAITRKHVSTL